MTALSSAQIQTALQSLHAHPAARACDVQVVDETGSTNADLLAACASLRTPRLLLAERQTAGRGRAGRAWHSAAEASLTFSLAWQFSQPLHALLGLPLAVGVALAECLADLGLQVQLKWPNDVLKDGKKLAGILIETTSNGLAQNWAVIGVGMNLQVSQEMEDKIGKSVADAPWLAQLDRNTLAAHLLDALARAMSQFAEDGFGAFGERWNTFHAYKGQDVVILDQGSITREGRALGVDQQGRLLLDCADGQIAILAGDVSLRSAAEWARQATGAAQ